MQEQDYRLRCGVSDRARRGLNDPKESGFVRARLTNPFQNASSEMEPAFWRGHVHYFWRRKVRNAFAKISIAQK